jgi:hypothetical protein
MLRCAWPGERALSPKLFPVYDLTSIDDRLSYNDAAALELDTQRAPIAVIAGIAAGSRGEMWKEEDR